MIFKKNFFDFMKINFIINFLILKYIYKIFRFKNIKKPYDFLKKFFRFYENQLYNKFL